MSHDLHIFIPTIRDPKYLMKGRIIKRPPHVCSFFRKVCYWIPIVVFHWQKSPFPLTYRENYGTKYGVLPSFADFIIMWSFCSLLCLLINVEVLHCLPIHNIHTHTHTHTHTYIYIYTHTEITQISKEYAPHVCPFFSIMVLNFSSFLWQHFISWIG